MTAGGARAQARREQVCAFSAGLVFLVEAQEDRPVGLAAIANKAGGQVARKHEFVV